MDGRTYTARFEAPGGIPVKKSYPDPITKAAPWTCGLGHTGPDVGPDTVWTQEHGYSVFDNDYAVAYGEAAHVMGTSCWTVLNEQRRAVVTDLAFEMGQHGLAAFQKMRAAICAGDWQGAAAHMLDSDYARELKALQSDKAEKTRAEINADTLTTGEWPDETS